jgi:hypothetical protein
MKNLKFFEDFESSDFSNQSSTEIHEGHDYDLKNYMFFQNLHTLKNAIDELLELAPHQVDQILSDGHGWALDHIATSVDDVEEVYHFLSNSIEMGNIESGHEDSMDHKKAPMEIDVEGNYDNVEVESDKKEEE